MSEEQQESPDKKLAAFVNGTMGQGSPGNKPGIARAIAIWHLDRGEPVKAITFLKSYVLNQNQT